MTAWYCAAPEGIEPSTIRLTGGCAAAAPRCNGVADGTRSRFTSVTGWLTASVRPPSARGESNALDSLRRRVATPLASRRPACPRAESNSLPLLRREQSSSAGEGLVLSRGVEPRPPACRGRRPTVRPAEPGAPWRSHATTRGGTRRSTPDRGGPPAVRFADRAGMLIALMRGVEFPRLGSHRYPPWSPRADSNGHSQLRRLACSSVAPRRVGRQDRTRVAFQSH